MESFFANQFAKDPGSPNDNSTSQQTQNPANWSPTEQKPSEPKPDNADESQSNNGTRVYSGFKINPLTLTDAEKQQVRDQMKEITPIFHGIGNIITKLYTCGGNREQDKIQKLTDMV